MPSTPLFAPEEFFTQRTPSLLSAGMILLLAGIVAVASAAPYINQVSSIEFSTGTLIVSVLIGGAIGAAGIWIVGTVAVYLLTAVAGGSGSVVRVAANVGWSSLPLLLVNTISTVIIWALALSGELSMVTPPEIQFPSWLRVFSAVLCCFGFLRNRYNPTYGIHHARRLPVRKSGINAGTIVFLPILSNVFRLL